MTWALAEVGRPGPARDVLDGGDVDPTTGRLLSVGELQAALRAARSGSTRQSVDEDLMARQRTTGNSARAAAAPAPSCAPAPAPPVGPRSAPTPTSGRHTSAPPATAPALRPPPGRRWVAVLGAHQGAGTSTVAVALADALAVGERPVHLVSCNAAKQCGLIGAATVELGTDPTGTWRTGRRGAGVTIARPAPGVDPASHGDADTGLAWPPVPVGVGDADLLTVVDTEPGAARAPQQLASAAAVLLVCRVSDPGVRQAEQILGLLLETPRAAATWHGSAPVVLVAAVGDDGLSGRWPRAVRRACGPLLGRLQSDGRVFTVPSDRHLATYGPTGSPLPRPVARSAALAVRLLDSTGALSRSASTDHSPRTATASPPPAHPAPGSLLDDKDTHR